ncbi:MAG TPA: Spy/CpxP family protein refolding chaperone [Thermoanaerobaculia bacterium]|nr:Spy/CpxP family protein refolding chaperone [Thermoanaerobaculia bacterium]
MTRHLRSPRPTALAGAAALLLAGALAALPLLAQPPGRGPGPGTGPGVGAADGGSPLRGPGGFPLRGLAASLDLTEQQIEAARALLEDLAAEVRPQAEEARGVREELHALLDTENPDPAEVGALVVELHGIRDEMRTARDGFAAAFSALLTPDQLERWEVLKDARGHFRGRHQGWGRRGHHGRGR